MQRNTKRIVGKGVVCLLCFLLGGVATLGITWHLLGQDGGPCSRPISSLRSGLWGSMTRRRTSRATLETMVDSLGDRWSYYLDPEEAQRTPGGPEQRLCGHRRHREPRAVGRAGDRGSHSGQPRPGGRLAGGGDHPRRGRPGHPAGDPGGGGGGHQGGGGHLAHPGGGGRRRHPPDGGAPAETGPWDHRRLEAAGGPGGAGDHPELLRRHRRPGEAGGGGAPGPGGPGPGL